MELDDLFAEVTPFIQPELKLCRTCGQQKPLSSFNNRNDSSSADRHGKVSKCKECSKAAAKAWYYGDHEKAKELARATQYRQRHKTRITAEEASKLAENNVGYCDLCSEYGIIFLDHDHKTEARRGFLCSRCNFALGGFKDSPELLQKAAAYLIRYRSLD